MSSFNRQSRHLIPYTRDRHPPETSLRGVETSPHSPQQHAPHLAPCVALHPKQLKKMHMGVLHSSRCSTTSTWRSCATVLREWLHFYTQEFPTDRRGYMSCMMCERACYGTERGCTFKSRYFPLTGGVNDVYEL